MTTQWGIQDSLEEGVPTLQEGAPTYDIAKNFQKMHEIEKIFGSREGHAPGAAPLDPLLHLNLFLVTGRERLI